MTLPPDSMDEAILLDVAWRWGNNEAMSNVAGTSAAGDRSGFASAGRPLGDANRSAEIWRGADEYARPSESVDILLYEEVLSDGDLAIILLTDLKARSQLGNASET